MLQELRFKNFSYLVHLTVINAMNFGCWVARGGANLLVCMIVDKKLLSYFNSKFDYSRTPIYCAFWEKEKSMVYQGNGKFGDS